MSRPQGPGVSPPSHRGPPASRPRCGGDGALPAYPAAVVADLLLGALALVLGVVALGADAGPLGILWGLVMAAMGAGLVAGLLLRIVRGRSDR